jgi:hypothetical protein
MACKLHGESRNDHRRISRSRACILLCRILDEFMGGGLLTDNLNLIFANVGAGLE